MKGTLQQLIILGSMFEQSFPYEMYHSPQHSSIKKTRGIRVNIVPGKHKLPRNMKCPCGSGKKNKVCHKFTYIRKFDD